MKKLLVSAAVAVSLVSMVPAAQAATATSPFNVTVALTAACEVTSVTDVAFTYSSFQPGAAVATPGVIDLRCTNTLAYTLSLDAVAGTVLGLNYTLALPSAAGVGTGLSNTTHTITGGMVSGQSGTCSATPPATCAGNDIRTLTVTF